MCDLWYYIGDEDQNKRQRQPSTNKPHNRLVLSAKRLTWRRPQERVKKIESQKSGYRPNKNNCGRCGNPSNHTTCPAMGASCKKCGKKNHYARVCLGKTKPPTEHRNHRSYQSRNRDRTDPTNFRVKHDYKATDKPQKGQTRRTRHMGHHSSDDSSSDDCFMHHLKTYHTSQDGQWKTCTIQINEVTIQAEPDSGSDTNIMDEVQFKKLHWTTSAGSENKRYQGQVKNAQRGITLVTHALCLVSERKNSPLTLIGWIVKTSKVKTSLVTGVAVWVTDLQIVVL